jgi:hypothetical protein
MNDYGLEYEWFVDEFKKFHLVFYISPQLMEMVNEI